MPQTESLGRDAFKCQKCGAALGWCEPFLCDKCRESGGGLKQEALNFDSLNVLRSELRQIVATTVLRALQAKGISREANIETAINEFDAEFQKRVRALQSALGQK